MSMCIVQVLPALGQGGVERGTIEVATALQKEGIRNYVVSAGGKMVPELEKIGVEHIQLPVHSKNPVVMWLNSYRLARVFREKGATLVHVRSRAPAWPVKWACRRLGIPFIASFHGVYGLKPRWLKKFYNQVMLAGRHVIAVSNHVKQHIIDNYGIPSDKITVIHRGADIVKFDPEKVSDADVEALRQKYHIPDGLPIITLVGRLTGWKGQRVLLDACHLMKNKDFVCLFVGSDQGRVAYRQELEQKAAELEGKPQVVFIDSCSEMPALYRLSSIVVNASLDPEAFGRTITEAQAMGRIVVATAHGGACETIQDGKTGFLVPVGDAQALADCLDQVLTADASFKAKIEKNAEESVRNNFSVQKMCDKTIALYRHMHN